AFYSNPAVVCLAVTALWILLCSLAPQGCPVLSLANLFDRVIQHSARMHGLSSDLRQDFVSVWAPSRNHIGRVSRYCHTSSILTPNDKENAQRMTEELTEVILKLLVAWREPLWADKALQVGRMVHELRTGVQRVAQKMQMLGMMGNAVSGLWSPDAQAPPDDGSHWNFGNYDLLRCFRRDSNKVQNYLKILKCRTVPEYGC
uniref:Prolactin 2 n=1 Tax=Neogobius melanostomus TaxID=47308 RepID=A0A8C6T7X6_9GOBI